MAPLLHRAAIMSLHMHIEPIQAERHFLIPLASQNKQLHAACSLWEATATFNIWTRHFLFMCDFLAVY